MAENMAENGGLSDCSHCRSAGSVRMGRCEICEWEADPTVVRTDRDDEGRLTAVTG